MPKKKTKDWVNTVFSLDPEIKEKIKELAEFEGTSNTGLVEFLVKNWDAGINPATKLNILLSDRKKLTTQVDSIDGKIEVLTKQIKLFDDWKKQKSQKKEQALPIIKRKLLEKDFESVERIAKVWQRMTGIPAIELIAEATQQIQRSGI